MTTMLLLLSTTTTTSTKVRFRLVCTSMALLVNSSTERTCGSGRCHVCGVCACLCVNSFPMRIQLLSLSESIVGLTKALRNFSFLIRGNKIECIYTTTRFEEVLPLIPLSDSRPLTWTFFL